MKQNKSDLAGELAKYDGDLRRMFKRGRALVKSEVSLAEIISRRQLSGGKRLRAVVALLSGRLCGLPDAMSDKTAVAIEFIHTATLLHDDVVDEAVLRRRQSTANHVYGNSAAVLAGDFLYSRASQILADIGCMPLLVWIADATNSLAEGEIMQLEQRGCIMTKDIYFNIIRRKTANLFEAATAAAVLIADRPAVLAAMTAYGRHLGMAFQLIDDCLDYVGSDAEMGKKIGADFAEGKMTLPAILALEKTNGTTRRRLLTGWKKNDDVSFADTLRLARETGALDEVHRLAAKESELAIAALDELSPSLARDSLTTLAKVSVNRRC
ncbi:polyprenyl synthetase family protein [Candidatus Persebacteraceae bacterium Df01]|uniref:Polyprenyl synthetase family protein n=1 Tax=Candidatus Doriopsillibacter californiensis TaxID=2970740 RepID=A0ABT7QM08_9GAMM|nr:polyprenyl synthetase family protein [Candidatus Persebacteraceae bacterium Df01]